MINYTSIKGSHLSNWQVFYLLTRTSQHLLTCQKVFNTWIFILLLVKRINRLALKIQTYLMSALFVVVQWLSHVQLFVTPWAIACQAPWDFPGKNTGVSCHFLLQRIFPTQGLNICLLHLLHWKVDSLPLNQQRSPFECLPTLYWTSLVAQTAKRLSTMWETRVWALGGEDALEKEVAIHSSTIAWKIPWTEEPGRLQSMGSQRVRHDWATSLSLLYTKHHCGDLEATNKRYCICPKNITIY